MTPSLRLLILITDLEIGGTPTVVRELSTRLARRGHAVEVACLSKRGPVADEIEQAGICVTALGASGVFSAGVLPRLIRLIRERNITTVYSLLVHANAIAATASLFCRDVRLIQSIQTTQLRPRWHWPVQSIAAMAAQHVIVPSQSVAEVAQSRADIPREKIIVIPNAIDVDAFNLERSPHAHITRTIGRPRVGFIGRLDPIKRVPDLIEAAAILREQIHLDIFGDGPDRPRIESTITRLDVKNVTLHGQIARPQEALCQIDLLVLPSEAEGFGLVLIEAMAARVPVIGTNVPGIRDVVKNEVTGLLVSVAAPEELAGAIARITNDDGFRQRVVEHAYREVVAKFSWMRAIAEYEWIFMGRAPVDGMQSVIQRRH